MLRTWFLMSLALGAGCVELADESTLESFSHEVIAKPFQIRAVGNKCVDAGGLPWQTPGAAVFIYTCNGTNAQQFLVHEHTDGTRDVSLRAVSGLCLGVRGGWVSYGQALELQVCDGRPAQRFALDGDAIYMGFQGSGQRVSRELVIEAQGQRGADRTPLVVGVQDTDPNEDLRFVSLDATAPRPTSGFVRVPSQVGLSTALATASWGTVVEIDAGAVVTDRGGHVLREGVTLRGGQTARHIAGPEIRVPEDAKYQELTFLRVAGDRTRITGIRLRGPSTSQDNTYFTRRKTYPFDTIQVLYPVLRGIHAPWAFRTVIDQNEISAFPNAALEVQGDNLEETLDACANIVDPRPEHVRIFRNFIHSNRRDSKGYGVVLSRGGFAYIGGNAFNDNRHAIAADGRTHTGYRALGNLVLHLAPWQGPVPLWQTQDFDMHGADGDDGRGGVAGAFVEIGSNTFLGDREAYELRGDPCIASTFHHNAVHEDRVDALESHVAGEIREFNNLFEQSDPTDTRAPRGDFDGDGLIDHFMATGAGWYYVSNNVGPWRYLRMATERVNVLGFSDYDADGRTDIWRWRGDGNIDISWGGTSPWNVVPYRF